MKCPKCGNTELEELGTGVDGEIAYGCQKCHIRFIVYWDFDEFVPVENE